MENPRLKQLFTFLEMDPTDAFTRYSIGYEYVGMGESEKALACFEALKSDIPEYVGTYYIMGKTLESLNRKEEAAAIYKEGISVAESRRDFHALAELRTALNEVLGLDE
jgi:tetratricopeptide (TPR) repeat protein